MAEQVVMHAMEPALTQEIRTTVSPAMVAYAGMLALSSPELEEAVELELSENPALERADVARCQLCGAADPASCCGSGPLWPPRVGQPAARPAGDPPADVPASPTGADRLLEEIRWSAQAQDARLAAYVLASLDDHGFLRGGPGLVAAEVGTDIANVERALSQLRAIGPPAIGARDLRESLLLQLDALCRPDQALTMARAVVDGHLDQLGRGRFGAVAAALGCERAQVLGAREFIRTHCSPFPAAGLREPDSPIAPPAVPSVVICASGHGDGGLRVELMEPARSALRIDPNYDQLAARLSQGNLERDPIMRDRQLQAHVAEYVRRASSFIARLDERFRTIRQVVEYAADRQRDFVLIGPRYLRPLTQADAARDLGIHESTVSRAVAGKYVMMPSRLVVPIQDFFRAALAPQEALRQLISTEERPLSDAALAQRLAAQGFPTARRTVAKYRDQLGFPSAPLRRLAVCGDANRLSP